jgi:hypothetical protein
MKLHTFATFESDVPEDGEFTAHGDIKHPPGRNVVCILAEMLKEQGLTMSEPQEHNYYGWSITASRGDVTFWFLLQFPGPWLLLSRDRTASIRKLFRSNSSLHHQILRDLNRSLARDGRFRAIRWFTKEQYERGDGIGLGGLEP